MSISLWAGRLFLAGCALFVLCAAAEAQIRYVASTGNDAFNCAGPAFACRTLQRGVAATPTNGELRILDSGFFGPGVSITKSLTLSGNGSTVMLSGPIEIDASVRVTLRDLLLNGRGVTRNALLVHTAESVHITGCEFERFAAGGAVIGPVAEAHITDSTFRNNGDPGLTVAAARVSIENSRFEDNAFSGLKIINGNVAVVRSTFSGNGDDGITQLGGSVIVSWSTAVANKKAGYALVSGLMHLESSIAQGNVGHGLRVNTGALAIIANLMVSRNNTGIQNSGLTLSRGNSTVRSNGINVAGNPLESENAR